MFEFIILFLSLFIIASIIFYSLFVGISPMPSSKEALEAFEKIIKNLDLKQGALIYECGAAWGSLAFYLAKHFPHYQIVAFEFSPVPYLWMRLRYLFFYKGNNLLLKRSNFLKEDLNPASLFTCYLCPSLMQKLEEKWQREMKKDQACRYLISNSFVMPGLKAKKEIALRGFLNDRLYLYYL